MAPSEPPVALVLAGGGRLSAVQVGMLRALVETGLRPAFAIGSSVLEGDGGLVPDSMLRGYKARTEQLILVHRLCLGLELPPTNPTAVRGCECRCSSRGARCADCRA